MKPNYKELAKKYKEAFNERAEVSANHYMDYIHACETVQALKAQIRALEDANNGLRADLASLLKENVKILEKIKSLTEGEIK